MTLRVVFIFIIFILNKPLVFSQNLYLSIIGENENETRIIDSLNYGKSFSDFNSLKIEIDSVNSRIQRKGYIENKIVSTSKINDSTYLSKFSLKRRFYTIYIYYPKNDLSKTILNNVIKEVHDDYFITSVSEVETILNYLNSKIIENGQPFAKLNLTNLKKKDNSNLQANLKINYDRERKIDNIVIKGYEKFPRSYLKHFLKIRRGHLFNLELIKEKTEALNSILFANQTRSPEVLFTKDSTSLYFYIEKTKANAFDGFLGFGTNELTNKIEFDGYLNLSLTNNLNYGESFELKYKSDENDQKNFDVALNLPYILGSALGTELKLNIFKKDSTFTTVSQSAEVFYQINKNQRLFAGIKGVQSNVLLDELVNSNIEDYNTSVYTLKYTYSKPQLNSLLFPKSQGLELLAGLGTRKINISNEEQEIFNAQIFKIFNLNNKNSIYINATSAGIFSDTYLSNELLRFGGITSIRGFEENSLIASLYGVLNTEYRYKVSPSIYVHSIVDAAYLNDESTGLEQKLFGFGFGFGLITKAGLLKFNYANGKFEGQKFKFSDSKIHLSLNARF